MQFTDFLTNILPSIKTLHTLGQDRKSEGNDQIVIFNKKKTKQQTKPITVNQTKQSKNSCEYRASDSIFLLKKIKTTNC